MKHRILATILLASSLSILLWGSIPAAPPQNEQESSNNAIATLCEKPGNGSSSNFSDEEDINSI